MVNWLLKSGINFDSGALAGSINLYFAPVNLLLGAYRLLVSEPMQLWALFDARCDHWLESSDLFSSVWLFCLSDLIGQALAVHKFQLVCPDR